MQQFLWEIVVLLTVTGGASLLFCYKRSSSFGVTNEAMMRVITNHALSQSQLNDISELQVLDVAYSPDGNGALAQVLCRRVADGNSTIRLYFIAVNDNRCDPRLIEESPRSLERGNRLAFYGELKPINVAVHGSDGGHWVEAEYQQMRLSASDSITANWKAVPITTKFAIALQQPTDDLISPAISNSN